MPRVLLTGFCAVPGPRRAGVQIRHVVRALTPFHTIDLLVMREGDQAYVERQGSVRVLRVPMQEAEPRAQIQAFQRALKRQLDGADYDVVHCRDSWSALPVLEARARFGFAVVYDLARSPLGETTHDAELDAQVARDEEACLLAADLVLAPTLASVKALQRRGRPERVRLAPPGVDVDRFDWDVLPRTDPPRIVYIGSIDPGRGVRVLVRAMTTITREVDARLVLAGPIAPAFEQGLKDRLRELGLTDKVELLGPVDHDQIPALLSTATVCVVPAAADLAPNPNAMFPTKLLEYMACRCAIVAPRRDTITQVVEHAHEALLFEPGDPGDLARQVLRLLGEPALAGNLAHNAYERVRRDFTASAARRAIRAAYDVLSARFADRLVEAEPADEAPKVVLLADDDFETTVMEEVPRPPARAPRLDLRPLETSRLDDALSSFEDSTGSGVAVVPREGDETQERPPAAPGPSGPWSIPLAPPPAPTAGDWLVASPDVGADAEAAAVADADLVAEVDLVEDEGTPAEGLRAAPPAPPSLLEGGFASGEIDVPTSPPAPVTPAGPSVEATRAPEPTTDDRTPALGRR